METTITVYQIHPAWIILFLLGYALGGYIFYKTVKLAPAVIAFAIFQITTVYIIYSYYGIPF